MGFFVLLFVIFLCCYHFYFSISNFFLNYVFKHDWSLNELINQSHFKSKSKKVTLIFWTWCQKRKLFSPNFIHFLPKDKWFNFGGQNLVKRHFTNDRESLNWNCCNKNFVFYQFQTKTKIWFWSKTNLPKNHKSFDRIYFKGNTKMNPARVVEWLRRLLHSSIYGPC